MDEQNTPQTDGDNQPPRSGDAALRELALILWRHNLLDPTGEGDEPQLLPGQMATNFGHDFPQPPGARVVGSLVTSESIVVLDTEQAGEDVVAFYRERLTAAGWRVQDMMGPRHGGFLHSGMVDRQFGNFYREDGPSLTVMAYAAPRGRTGIHLTLTPEGGAAIHERNAQRYGMEHNPWRILPPIVPPPHSEQFQEGGSGGEDRVSTSARVESELDLAALAAHYITQLERAGWQRTSSSGESDPVAWNTWTFADKDKEPWRALLVILKRPDAPRQCWAHLVAEWLGQRPRDGVQARASLLGWQSHTQTRQRP